MQLNLLRVNQVKTKMPRYEENILLILSSPSGAGKTTLTKKFNKNIKTSKSLFLAPQEHLRNNEVDGVDYHFISKKKFEELIKNNSFYNTRKFLKNYYGTLKQNVDTIIKSNDILFDIDWQGTKQLSKIKNLNLVKYF